MNRITRIALNLLLPPAIASVLLLAFDRPSDGFFSASDMPTLIFFAYASGFIPSIIHAFIMERFYRSGLLPSQIKAILVSAFSGVFSGALVLLTTNASRVSDLGLFIAWGSVTGAITALVIIGIGRASTHE